MKECLEISPFLEIEKKYNLYQDIIEGMNYWVYSRVEIWANIILKNHLELGAAHRAEKTSLKSKVRIYLKMFVNAFKKIKCKNVDFCIVNHQRRVLQDGYYECIYTDELARVLSNNIVLEFPYQMKHFTPVKTNNLFYMDEVILRKVVGLVLYRTIFKNKYKKIEAEVRSKTKKVLDNIEEVYDIKINKEAVVECIVQQIIYYKVSINYMKRIIEKINPKAVIEVVSYSPNCMMINEVCKEMKIKVIELQHGIMDEHIAYSYALPCEIKQFPDKVYMFSSNWKKYLKVPIKDENIIGIGYPFLERKINTAKKIDFYNDERINILFISQGTIGRKLSVLAGQLAEQLDLDKYRIFYKLHPGEMMDWKKNYPALLNDKLIVISGNEYSLYDYFATCQIQIGVYSTALYEGLGFGLATYIYRIELSEHMKRICQDGYAKFFENCDELVKKIKSHGKNNHMSEFWERNALKNMLDNIENML